MSRLVRSDSRESVFSVSSCVSGVGGWQVGDRARVDNRSGTVSFMGPTKFAPGEWIGLTLDEPMGKNDGSVSGHRYFTCTANHGLFIKSSKLERIVMSPARFFKSPTPGEASSKHAAEFGFDIGDRVMIGGGKIGYLRFLGETSFSAGIWAGIELDQPNGKNDGSVMGKRYFTCKHPHGIFAKAGTAEKAPTQGPSQVSVHHNKASILRTEMGKRTGSFESLNSIGSPSVASSRFGVRRGPLRPPVTSNLAENSTIKALQDALSEKEKHIEQLMAERDLAENAQMTSGHGQEGLAQKYEEKFKAADNKVKELRSELAAKQKEVEDLQFRLEEEGITKQCEIDDLQQAMATMSQATAPVATTTEDASAEKTRLQEEITAGKTQAEQEKQGLLEAQKKLQEQYDQLTASLNQQNSSESQKQAELLGEIQKTREDLRATVADLDACRDALLTQQNAVQELRSHLESVSKWAEEDAQKYAVATKASEDEASLQKEKLQKLEAELTAATALLQSREQELKGELATALASVEEQKKIISSMASEQGLSTTLQERITALETENGSQAKELKGLVEEKDGLAKKLEERVAEVQNANEERTKVEGQLKTMEEEAKVEREKASAKLQELSHHAEELKSQLESKQSAVIQLESELSSSKASWDSEKSTCEALRAELSTQQSTHSQELQKLADQSKQTENKIKELEEKAVVSGEKAKKEGAELRQKVEEAAAEGAQLKEKLTSALSDHEAGIVALKNAHHEQVASLSSQADSLASASKDLEDERDSLKRTVERCQEDLGKSKDELTRLSLELTNKSEQLVAANEARNGVQVELRTAQDAFATLQSTLESSKLGENEMAKEFSAVKEESASRLAENELLRSQLTDVKTELETAKGEIQKAREETARITTREREAEDAAADTIKKLERSLAGETTARSKLENEVREKEEELKAAKSRLELITAESTDSAGKLAALAADAKKKETDLEAVQAELQSTKEKFTSTSVIISDMERLISALEQGSLAARQELADKQAELDALTAALLSEQGSSAESASRLAKLTAQVTERQTKIDELTASSSSVEAHNKSLQEDLQKQIQELKEVSEKASNVNAGLQKEMEEIKLEKASVEEVLKSQLADREKELAEAVAKLEAEKSKFDAELSAANEEKSKLKKEITLNVEDLQKIKTHTEETAASSAETMSSLRNRCETLENELKAAQQCSEEEKAKMYEVASSLKTLTEEKSAAEGQAKAALESLTAEKKSLEEQLQQLNKRTDEADGAQKDMEEQVSLAQKSLADYANKIASLESKMAGEAEEKKAVEARLTSVEQEMGEKLRTAEEKLATARIQLEQAKREHSEAAGAQSTQMASEFAEAMETIRVLKEEKANLAKECDAADGRLSEQHGELLRLKAVEVEATVEISKAQQKMLLFDEVEDSLKKKNLDLVEKLSEMQDQLDTLQHQTQNDQIIQLNSQIEFLNRIVATKTEEANELRRERDNALNPQPIDVMTTHRKREKKIRLFCDMCDTFDLHETVDCPLQAMEEAEVAAHSHHTMTTPDGKKTKKAPREYCDECEEFGHDTSLCPKNQKKKRDYTF